MDSPIDLISFVKAAENCIEVLLTLASRSGTRPGLKGETDIPRALSRIGPDRELERRTIDGVTS